MEAIGGKYMQIAVLKRSFKTTNWNNNGIIRWEEMELINARPHSRISHLWICSKWDPSEYGERINLLTVSPSHLEFINLEWDKIR